MKKQICPACGSDAVVTRSYSSTVAYKGADLEIGNLLESVCSSCAYAFDTPEQHDTNIANTKATFLAQRAMQKTIRGLLTGKQIRAIREQLSLTQREAAELFGGGPIAFSKYESEDVVQSVPMDRLIRLVSLLGKAGLILLRSASSGEQQLSNTQELHYASSSDADQADHVDLRASTTAPQAMPIHLVDWQPISGLPN